MELEQLGLAVILCLTFQETLNRLSPTCFLSAVMLSFKTVLSIVEQGRRKVPGGSLSHLDTGSP